MVYISSATLSSAMRSAVMNTQAGIATAQAEVSSGTYADLGGTLGGSSGRLLSLTQLQASLASYTSSNAVATTRLSSTDSVLSTLQTAAQSFLSDLTGASSATSTTTDLTSEASSGLSALISGLNTSVGGQSIFGGLNTDGTTVAAYGSGSASKTAVDNAFSAAFGMSQTSAGASSITAAQMTTFLNGSFANLFTDSSFGSTWSTATDTAQSTTIAPGTSVTTSVSANDVAMRDLAQAYTMVKEFTGSNFSVATRTAVYQSAMTLVSQAISGLTTLQGTVGTAQNAITQANTQMQSQSTVLATEISGLHDTDTYALSTRITALQTQLEASYELTSQLKGMSLTNYYSA